MPHTVSERRTLCFCSYKNSKLNVKLWAREKKKEGIFRTVYFVWRKNFKTCVLSQCIVYRINFQNIHTFTNQKNITSYNFLLVFKIVKSLQCILIALKLFTKSFKVLHRTLTTVELEVQSHWETPTQATHVSS